MTPSPTADKPKDRQGQRRPRFWVAPLLVGACFSLGFGITKRVAILQVNAETPRQLVFAPARFPGRDLARLRTLYGGDPGDLQVDVSALPVTAVAAVEEPPPSTPAPALQAAMVPPQPEWTRPVWSEDPLEAAAPEPAPEPVVEEAMAPPPQPLVLGLPPMEPAAVQELEPPESFFIPVEAPPEPLPES